MSSHGDSSPILEQSGGRLDVEAEGPAFRMSDANRAAYPVLIAVPHAGRAYPPALIDNLRAPEETSIRLEDRHVDGIAIPAATQTGTAILIAEAPRALIDLNRDPQDIDWGMIAGRESRRICSNAANRRARSGLGLVPRRLPKHGELWRRALSTDELEARMSGVHRPYHETLGRMLETLRDRFGAALLIDLHSMPPLPRVFGDEPAVQFVIGDRFGSSCDDRIISEASQFFADRGKVVRRNRPYAGGYILDRHACPRRSIHAFQLEICRSTYLDAAMSNPTARAQHVAALVADLVPVLSDMLMDLAGGMTREAAE